MAGNDRIPLRRGTVTRVDTYGVYCSIPTLGTPQQEFGPMDSGHFDLRVGDRVIVGQAGYETENFVIITSLTPRPMPITAIYWFETTSARDALLPSPVVPTFAYVDDDQTIYIYSDEGGSSWRKVNWGINGVFADALAFNSAVTFNGTVALTQDATSTGKFTLTDNTKQFNVGSTPSTASFAAQRASNTNNVFSARVVADTLNRLEVRADGLLAWGTGAAAVDTDLYRNGVGILKTDGALQVGGALSSASLSTGAITATSLTPNIITLDDLSGVVISSPATGQTIRYNGGAYVNAKLAISDMSDVTLTSIAANQALVWNGTAWVNKALPLGVIWNHIVASNTTFTSNFNAATNWYSTSSPVILANRSYKITARVLAFTGGGAQIKVNHFVTINGTRVGETGPAVLGADSGTAAFQVVIPWNSGASPGTPTFAAGCERTSGAQNFDMVASATNPAALIIEDMGPVRSD